MTTPLEPCPCPTGPCSHFPHDCRGRYLACRQGVSGLTREDELALLAVLVRRPMRVVVIPEKFRKKPGVDAAPSKNQSGRACVYFGEALRDQDSRVITQSCQDCGEKSMGILGRLVVHGCYCPSRGETPRTTLAFCRSCDFYKDKDRTESPCGVVVGHYGMPGLVELHCKLIRKHCGDVPILVSDDRTENLDRLRDVLAPYQNVLFFQNERHLGHYGGDGAAFYRAITVGKRFGLRYVAKLSQRFVVDTPHWLQDGARELAESGLPAAGYPGINGGGKFDLRTEAVLLDVDKWHRKDVLAWLEPREYRHGITEWYVWGAIVTFLGGKILPWKLLGGPDRRQKAPGVLWHTANTEEEYRALAAREGIDLGPEFHTI